ncbi:MAG TPA: hypothetical protein VIP82_20665 [Microbacterium sp.]|uniref:hypothetical protein n=1 Tax=Microbacterium sp. TaxID=51671 RepID=UPI002F947117
MSDDLDFSQFPQTLDLLSVHIPVQQQYVVRNHRVFLTSVEFWNLRTTFRLTWPLVEDDPYGRLGAGAGDQMEGPRALGSDGHDYGCYSFSRGGDGIVADATFNTREPMPLLDWVELRMIDDVIRAQLR